MSSTVNTRAQKYSHVDLEKYENRVTLEEQQKIFVIPNDPEKLLELSNSEDFMTELVGRDHLDLLRFLAEHNRAAFRKCDNPDETLLFEAARKGKFRNIAFILSERLVDPNVMNLNASFLFFVMTYNQITYKFEGEDIIKNFIEDFHIVVPLDSIHPLFRRTYSSFKIPPLYVGLIDPTVKQAIIEDNLSTFLENISLAGPDVFLVACQYYAIDIIKYCTQISLGLDFKSLLRTTPFTYACYHNYRRLIEFLIHTNENNKPILIMKDANRNVPIRYISDNSLADLKRQVLFMRNVQIQHPQFRIFTNADFDTVKYEGSNSCGAYGETTHVVDRITGIDMVLKKYKNCPFTYNVIDATTVAEIGTLLNLTAQCPDSTVKIYGLFYAQNCVFLVLEYLQVTLTEILEITSEFSVDAKRVVYKQIMRNLIENINEIAKVGYVHNDLKPANIMYDGNGHSKLIDYGLTEFFGIYPSAMFKNNSVMTEFVKPPDAFPGDQLVKNRGQSSNYEKIDDIGGKVCSKKSYSSDIFSIGVIMMNAFYQSGYSKYIYNGTDFFFSSAENIDGAYRFENWQALSLRQLREIDPELESIMAAMLHWNGDERYNAKTCLQHKYFTGLPTPEPVLTWKIPGTNTYLKEFVYMEEFFLANRNYMISNDTRRDDLINTMSHYTQHQMLSDMIYDFCIKTRLIMTIGGQTTMSKFHALYRICEMNYLYHSHTERDFFREFIHVGTNAAQNKIAELKFLDYLRSLTENKNIMSFSRIHQLILYLYAKTRVNSTVTKDALNVIFLEIRIRILICIFFSVGNFTAWDIISTCYLYQNEELPILDELEPINQTLVTVIEEIKQNDEIMRKIKIFADARLKNL